MAKRVAASSKRPGARERARRSDDKKAAKAEKKAQKKEKQKADLADSAQFKGFDKVVVAELHFDDDDVKKSGFDLPYDAEKTALTKEEWNSALAEINGVFNHTGLMALLCCLCGDPEVPTRRQVYAVAATASKPRSAQDHVGDVQKKCKSLSEKYASRGVTFHCVHKEDVAGALAGIFTMGIAMNDDKVYLVVTQKDAE